MRFYLFLLIGIGIFSASTTTHAQNRNWGTLEGYIYASDTDEILPLANVMVLGTNYGTATNDEGFYQLVLPSGRHVIRFSSLGYAPEIDTVYVDNGDQLVRNITLSTTSFFLEEVTVTDVRPRTDASVYTIEPAYVETIPMPIKDGFRILKTVPGVASNNELSSEYSVRGGGYNENQVMLDGYEIYKSFRLRKGEQEGLGLINPDMVRTYTFYTGGFPAKYGGKLSSVLHADYRNPLDTPVGGNVSLSLLGGDAMVSGGSEKAGWMVGYREARTRHFFQTQQQEGTYDPRFTDLQGKLVLRLSEKQQLEALGVWARHQFDLIPRTQQTFSGSIFQPKLTDFVFAGDESDRYESVLLGLRLKSALSSNLWAEHDISYYDTREGESSNVIGNAIVRNIIINPATYEVEEGSVVGFFTQDETYRNDVRVQSFRGKGAYRAVFGRRHAAEAGWYAQAYRFNDQLRERLFYTSLRDSLPGVYLVRKEPVPSEFLEEVVRSDFEGEATLNAFQGGFYVQDAIDVLPTRDKLVVTLGLRSDYFSFNDEWMWSPRIAMNYQARENLVMTSSFGLYHQAPSYREFRGDPIAGQPLSAALNRDLQSQRSWMGVLGFEYFMPKKRRFYRVEAYYKKLDRLITYDVTNVRLSYSGDNDAQGYTFGLDFQVHGELVPGLESWFNYSYMRSRERFIEGFQTPANTGWVPRTMDQSHTASLFVQDYFPRHPSVKFHIRLLFGSGFPYSPPTGGPSIDNAVAQVEYQRNQARYPAYRRVDAGFTKAFGLGQRDLDGHQPLQLTLTAELLNAFNMVNTIQYDWAPVGTGIWERIPTYLTPRTFNLRLNLIF